MRFHLPLGFTVSTLAASMYFFPQGYSKANMGGVGVDNIRWGGLVGLLG